MYWIAALITTPPEKETVPVNIQHVEEFPRGKEAEKISVSVEYGRNLYNPLSTLVLTETTQSELANWTKIYFFGYLSLGTMIFASDFPGL